MKASSSNPKQPANARVVGGYRFAPVCPDGEWEPDADNWVRWARTPKHDAYWYYRDRFFDELVPPPGRRTLEMGCGEGRVARDLRARGYRVVGVDTSQTLLNYARLEDTASSFVRADGAALPFPDGSFDLAVGYNSLQVVADMAGTVSEVARLLGRGGHFCFCVAHPVTDLGRFADGSAAAPFILRNDYFARTRVDESVEKGGLRMRFRGWTYALEDYAVALEQAAFKVEAIREPRPSRPGAYDRWNRVPMFLMVRAVKE
jgi:SAM-dependent methyltransferase